MTMKENPMGTSAPAPYYDVDGITIYHADCTDVLPHVDPHDVSLVLTDPPYGINLGDGWSNEGRTAGGALPNGTGRAYLPVAGDDEPFDPAPLFRFGRVILWGANHYAPHLPLGQWVVWRKRGASPLFAAAELAWHNCGGRPVDYFETTVNSARLRDGHLHPTQKPVDLMRWLVGRFTESEDLVLDPYMGSGPVAQACHEMGRRYIGVELVEDYCRIAVERLKQQTLDLGA